MGSLYSHHLVLSTNFCSIRTFHLGSFLHSAVNRTAFSLSDDHVVHSSWQRPCYSFRVSSFCSPCGITSAGSRSQGFGSSCCCLSYGSRISYSLSCGSSGFRTHDSLQMGYGTRFCHPSYVPYTIWYRPSCGIGYGVYWSTLISNLAIVTFLWLGRIIFSFSDCQFLTFSLTQMLADGCPLRTLLPY